MPRNGMGTYTLPSNSWNPAVSGTTIESSASNATNEDLASALTQSVSKDGQTTMTGALPMGNNKITGLANGTTSTDAMAYGQGAKLTGDNTFTGDQTINGSVSLSGSLTVTGPVIFTSGTISVGDLTVTSVASIASLNVTGTTNLNLLNVSSTASLGGTTNANVLNVASVASVNKLTVASTAAIAVLSVGSSIVIGAASGGSKGAGTINAVGIYVNGQAVTGKAVQVVNTTVNTYDTTLTGMNVDNSIPLITEGKEFMTRAITPQNASNTLKIDVVVTGSINTSPGSYVVALFQDATANALQATADSPPAANRVTVVAFSFYMTAGTTSSTTFRVRAGPNDGGAFYFNGASAAQIFNGTCASSITITEYAA